MKILQKIGAGLATGALLTVASVPSAFAATDVNVSGNGAFSDNNAAVSSSCSTSLDQTNVSNISNNVVTRANTGGNTASFNTGGSVTIFTGDATTDVEVSNAAGSNVASVDGSGCSTGSTDVSVHGNGAFSDNSVYVRNWDRESWRQFNANYLRNQIYTNLTTGNNSANFNTGTDVVIHTGSTNADVEVENEAGSNVLH